MRLAIAAAAAIALFYAPHDVVACTPIDFGDRELTPSTAAPEMVARASTIELMRVTARTEVSADPVYAEIYATPIYQFRFESVEVLKGRSRGDLLLPGIGADARHRYAPDLPIPRRDPLWWSGDEGFEALIQSTLIDPTTTGSVACLWPFDFDVGATYLVFRDADGQLMSPGFRYPARPSWPSTFVHQFPVVEVVPDDADIWLREVRSVIVERGYGPDTFWTVLFQVIFGNRRSN